MTDNTAAALQALIQQVTTLTETVQKQDEIIRGVKDHNDRLLDKVKDDSPSTRCPFRWRWAAPSPPSTAS